MVKKEAALSRKVHTHRLIFILGFGCLVALLLFGSGYLRTEGADLIRGGERTAKVYEYRYSYARYSGKSKMRP